MAACTLLTPRCWLHKSQLSPAQPAKKIPNYINVSSSHAALHVQIMVTGPCVEEPGERAKHAWSSATLVPRVCTYTTCSQNAGCCFSLGDSITACKANQPCQDQGHSAGLVSAPLRLFILHKDQTQLENEGEYHEWPYTLISFLKVRAF